MVNNIFKTLYLIVAVCLVIVLFGIYRNMEQSNRYMVIGSGQSVTIYDTKTHKFYEYFGFKFYNSKFKEIKEIPK